VKRLGILLLLVSTALAAQSITGELRLTVTDPGGLGVKGVAVDISSAANEYHTTLVTDGRGRLAAERLPFGVYVVHVHQPGFAEQTASIEIRSALPAEFAVKLALATVEQSVTVNAEGELLNPEQAGAVSQIGAATIQDRLSSLPGRSMQDLVNAQPGWLYEGNAVLHPRGSEYQTQFVVDGIPLTDNRSPSFGPEIGGISR
jgi:Carboxypeptidase regulatory-like domain